MQRFRDLDEDFEAFARDHLEDNEFYEHSPDKVEPSSHKRQRLYRALEYLIRSAAKSNNEKAGESKTPHVLAVSHFEVITHLINDVFGIESIGRYNAPAFGESVYIEGYPTEDSNIVRLKVRFNEHERDVFFDRSTRSIQHTTS